MRSGNPKNADPGCVWARAGQLIWLACPGRKNLGKAFPSPAVDEYEPCSCEQRYLQVFA
ncbi:conserved hypothetical protein [Roseibium sp. TrichSKD4]|nr:conserved hypothetical protein [Roseibium sp. TrichSKD4]